MSSMHAHAPKGAVSVKAMIAVFAAGVLAGVVALLPLVLPDQEPSPGKQTIAAASTDARATAETPAAEEPAPDPCAGQTWPYIDGACADAKAKEQDTRQVRVISTDRAAPTTLATRTPRIEPKPVIPEPPKAEPAPVAAGEPVKTEPPAVATPTQPEPAQIAAAPQPAAAPPPAPPSETSSTAATEPKPAVPASVETKPAVVDVKQVPVETNPVAETKPAVAGTRPAPVENKPTATTQTAALPAVEPTPAAEPAPRKFKPVTVSSSKPKRSRPQPAATQPGTPAEPIRELARGRTQPVPDPGRSLGGPTVVRTYDYADGRRVTVYQRADRAGGGHALAEGGELRGSRRVLVQAED